MSNGPNVFESGMGVQELRLEYPTGAFHSPLTSILGREGEIDRILRLLDRDDLRLVTLLGAGGVGKTRLAMEVARIVEGDFAHGGYFISLASIRDPELVPAAVARSLGVLESPVVPVTDQLEEWLEQRHMLLVLDNLEQLAGSVSQWLKDLLVHCPRLKVLATSRSPLHLSGEQRFQVNPLPVVQLEAGSDGPSPAVTLFSQRASSVLPTFQIDGANDQIVAQICNRLGGLPLAIELAAARVNIFPVAEILTRLTDQLTLLSGGRRDVPLRSQSMRDAIGWSYNLLELEEQVLFRRLSVFVGGFTLDAAERVCAGIEQRAGGMAREYSVLNLVGSLVDQNLIAFNEYPDGTARYSMMESVLAFARQEVEAEGEREICESAHAEWCLELAEAAEKRLVSEVHTATLRLLESEHPNLRRALEWSLDPTRNRAELALQMAGALWLFWFYHSHLVEGRRWLETAVSMTPTSDSRYRARALRGLGNIAHYQGDDERALDSLNLAVAMSRLLGDGWATAFALSVRGNLAEDQGSYDEARLYFGEAKTRFGEAGDGVNVAVTLYHLGIVAYGEGDLDQSLEQCQSAMNLAHDLGDPWTQANALCFMGLIHIARDERHEAAITLAKSLVLYREMDSTIQIVEVFRRTAVLAQVSGNYLLSLKVFAAAHAIGRQIGAMTALPERAAYDRALHVIKHAISVGEYQAAWQAGQRLGLPEALAAVTAFLDSGLDATPLAPIGDQPHVVAANAYGLSIRELEVLRLIAEGMSNRQIAEALFLSHRTVATHVTHILAKMSLSSRTAAVSWAIRYGIT